MRSTLEERQKDKRISLGRSDEHDLAQIYLAVIYAKWYSEAGVGDYGHMQSVPDTDEKQLKNL